MKLRNTTDLPTPFLRAMVRWVAKETQLPVSKIREINFTKTKRWWRGWACSSMRVTIRIASKEFWEANAPLKNYSYPGLKKAPVYDINDRTEALLQLTAHELEHLYDYSENVRVTRESQVDWRALQTLEKFRAARERLLAEWSSAADRRAAASPAPTPTPATLPTPTPTPAAPRPIVQARADKAAADLAKWERRLKLAKTKVAQYRRRVTYYNKQKKL